MRWPRPIDTSSCGNCEHVILIKHGGSRGKKEVYLSGHSKKNVNPVQNVPKSSLLTISDCTSDTANRPVPMLVDTGGLRFTDFHTASACSSTHVAFRNRQPYCGVRRDGGRTPGYEGYLNDRVAALLEVVQDEGYLTLMSGKWPLGLRPERFPAKRGFEKSFAFLPGAANPYNYEPQLRNNDVKSRLEKICSASEDHVVLLGTFRTDGIQEGGNERRRLSLSRTGRWVGIV
jgi:Sulfatase